MGEIRRSVGFSHHIRIITYMVNTERLLATFLQLVQLDSPSGHEQAVAEYVRAYLRRIGISSSIDAYGNVLARLAATRAARPMLLSAHLDTVEPGRGIVPKVHNGTIRSSGTTVLGADNKVAVAAILEALTVSCEHSTLMPVPVELVFTVSEEVANLGAVHVDYRSLRATYGYTFDSANPIGTIITASPYYSRFDAVLTGVACHASRPEAGVNALTLCVDALAHIPTGRIDKATVCNVGVVRAGAVRNTVPGEVVVQGEVRSFTEAGLVGATDHIHQAFAQATRVVGAAARVDVVRENVGFRLGAAHPLVRRGAHVLRGLTLQPVLKESYGCSDANTFYEHGITVLNFGNGVRDNHTVSESITTDDLGLLARLVLSLITGQLTEITQNS